MSLIPLTHPQLETLHALTLVEPATTGLVQVTLGHDSLPYARLDVLVELGLATRHRRKAGDPRNGNGKPPWIYELTAHGRQIGRALQPAVARMREWREDAGAITKAERDLLGDFDVCESGVAELAHD